MSQEVAVYSCVLWKSQWRIRNWSKIGYSCRREHKHKIEPIPPLYSLTLLFLSSFWTVPFPCTYFHLLLWNIEIWLLICCSALSFFSWTNWAVSQTLRYYRINLFWIAAIGQEKLDTTGNVLSGNKPSSLEKSRAILIWVQSLDETSSLLQIRWSA